MSDPVVPETPKPVRAKPVVKEPELLNWNGAFFEKVRSREPDPVLQEKLKRRLTHPTCLKCQEGYRKKFPGQAFAIECEGIYSEQDFQELSKLTGLTYEEAREILDIAYWGNRHVALPNSDGDLVPFVARNYQCDALWCTARRQVDRWGRGLGKTQTGIIRELHTAIHRKRFEILVACPMKAQAQLWYDNILATLERDPELIASLASKRQAPYFTFKFHNESKINIFTTGSKSGSDADSIRSQSPKRIRIDEQDLLNPGDYKAIMPLLRRYPRESQFHGSSTPLGKREDFWAMCNQYVDYRELHFPIMVHPEWNEEMEEACRREARTELNYIHEWLAEFGDQEGGCFRAIHVDAALIDYRYDQCQYDPKKKYVLGIDWNGSGTGTRFRVVQFDPATKKRRTVDAAMVNISTMKTLDKLVELNRKWHCDHVYVDAGFGYVQDELIRMIGQNSANPDDRRLMNVHVIDFGAKLETNKLVVDRERSHYIDQNELERPTKPFMVEGTVMAMEAGLVELSRPDRSFEEQVRAYRVKNYTTHGWANTYVSDVGDHDLDAWVLAMLGIEQHWGISHVSKQQKPAGVAYSSGFGEGILSGNPQDWARAPESARQITQKKGGVPSRQASSSPLAGAMNSRNAQVVSRNMYGSATTVITRPMKTTPQSGMGPVPSRTAGFQHSTSRSPFGANKRYGR